MIDYYELALFTSLDYLHEQISFTPNGTFSFAHIPLIKDTRIYSGQFFFDEKGCDLYFLKEIELAEKEEYVAIIEKMNKHFAEYRLGILKASIIEKNNRIWIGFRFVLLLPHECVKGKMLDTDLCLGIFRDFYKDMNGYAPLWRDKAPSVEYVSSWIKSTTDGGYTTLGGRIRVGDKINFGTDDLDD